MKKLLLVTALVAFVTLPVTGTTMRRMDLEALVNGSETQLIIQGRVEGMDVVFDEKLGVPFTRARIRVNETLCQRPRPGVGCQQGSASQRPFVVVKHVGGRYEVPGRPGVFRTTAASGIPQFQDGESVIVFLRPLGEPDTFQCVGLTQGKYSLVDELAVANITGVELIDPKTGRSLPAGFVDKAPVEAFKAKIREMMR
jgi:hypothetical protein